MSRKAYKEHGECRSSSRHTTSAMANSEADASTQSMEALARAVGAIQASIDSFREENQASTASLHTTLSALGQRITNVVDGLNEVDNRLTHVELSQASLAKVNQELRDSTLVLGKLHKAPEHSNCGDTGKRRGNTANGVRC